MIGAAIVKLELHVVPFGVSISDKKCWQMGPYRSNQDLIQVCLGISIRVVVLSAYFC
jgi:hypothetical protein